MAYCSQTDVRDAAGGDARLLELCDNAGTGTMDAAALAVLAGAIAEADATIDKSLQKRYAVPLAAVPTRVKNLSANEAVFVLKIRKDGADENAMRMHAARMRELKDIEEGKDSLGVDPPPAKSTAVQSQLVERSDSSLISRDTLKGMW